MMEALTGLKAGPKAKLQSARSPGAVKLQSVFPRSYRTRGARVVAAATDPASFTGLLELRQYTLKPEAVREFLVGSTKYAELRKSLLPFVGMFTFDTGGVLTRVAHMYAYRDFHHRDQSKAALGASEMWQKEYNPIVVASLVQPESSVYVPAKAVLAAAGAVPIDKFQAPAKQPGQGAAVYELRQYQLKGADPAAAVLVQLEKAMPNRVAADKIGIPVFVGSSETGLTSSIIEIWRYPSAQAALEAHDAVRKSNTWRQCLKEISPNVGSVSISFLNPVGFSPLQ